MKFTHGIYTIWAKGPSIPDIGTPAHGQKIAIAAALSNAASRARGATVDDAGSLTVLVTMPQPNDPAYAVLRSERTFFKTSRLDPAGLESVARAIGATADALRAVQSPAAPSVSGVTFIPDAKEVTRPVYDPAKETKVTKPKPFRRDWRTDK